MAVLSKKPKTPKLSEKQINNLISKGGETPPEPTKRKSVGRPRKTGAKKIPVQLRLSQTLIDTIDGLLDERVVTVSRHTWFMEAIDAKIKADTANL